MPYLRQIQVAAVTLVCHAKAEAGYTFTAVSRASIELRGPTHTSWGCNNTTVHSAYGCERVIMYHL